MTSYKPDEIVDLTITGARVVRTGRDDIGRAFLTFVHGEYNALATVDTGDPAVNVARVAPADWPPRPRDVWGTDDGGRWFAARHIGDPDDPDDMKACNDEGWRVVLIPLDVGPYGDAREGHPDEVRKQAGRMFLVHREDEQDGGDQS